MPEDAYALRGAMRGTSAAVHERDAYELWLAMLPPRSPRGVVVVDLPYEQTDERARITATLAAACRKWAHGVTVIWYPPERPRRAWAVEGATTAARHPELLWVEHWLDDRDQPGIKPCPEPGPQGIGCTTGSEREHRRRGGAGGAGGAGAATGGAGAGCGAGCGATCASAAASSASITRFSAAETGAAAAPIGRAAKGP